MILREILARRDAIAVELRAMNPEATEAAGRMDVLEAELRTLATHERRHALLDDAARREPGQEVEQRGDFGDEAGFGLRPEQRMVDWHQRQTGEHAAGLSVGRFIRGRLTGRWDGAEAEQRVMGTGMDSAGGFLIPDQIGANLIDLVRASSALIAAGASTVPMTGPTMRLVRVMGDPSPGFRGEGARIAESDGTFGALNLSAHSLAAIVRVNSELLDDVPSFGPTLDRMLAAAMGQRMDWAGLYGTGAGMPLGLRGTPGVNEISMGTNGAALADYDPFLTLSQLVREANGMPTAVIFAPRTATNLGKLTAGSVSTDRTKLVPPLEFAAWRRVVSSQVSRTEKQGSSNAASTAFLGDFSNLAFAIRQGVVIEASRVADDSFAKNQTLIRAIARFDVAVLRPDQFGRLVGIL